MKRTLSRLISVCLIFFVGWSLQGCQKEYKSAVHQFTFSFPDNWHELGMQSQNPSELVGWDYVPKSGDGPATRLFTLQNHGKEGQFGVLVVHPVQAAFKTVDPAFSSLNSSAAQNLMMISQLNKSRLRDYSMTNSAAAEFAGIRGSSMNEAFLTPSGKLQKCRHFIPEGNGQYGNVWIRFHSLSSSEQQFENEWNSFERNWKWK